MWTRARVFALNKYVKRRERRAVLKMPVAPPAAVDVAYGAKPAASSSASVKHDPVLDQIRINVLVFTDWLVLNEISTRLGYLITAVHFFTIFQTVLTAENMIGFQDLHVKRMKRRAWQITVPGDLN